MFADNVRVFRKLNKMTQEELARRTGLTLRTIQNYETGRAFPMKKETINTLAAIFCVPVSSLIGPEDFALPNEEEKPMEEITDADRARVLLADMSALFAGGKLGQADKDNVMRTLSDLYWEARSCAEQQASTEAFLVEAGQEELYYGLGSDEPETEPEWA